MPDRKPSPSVAPAPLSSDPHGGYQVVARRYRPQTFDDLVGQEQVVRALSNAIKQDRVAHAYLFCGARGVGKTSSARILAKCLNCQRGTSPTPCNECPACKAISTGDDVDVLEIDGASNRGIDEMRELRQNVGVRPIQSRYKIYIIDEVHMLTKEAFNALLKTLEEPPEHVKFIFCTTEAEKIPITILSRCQQFHFASIQSTAIAERLEQIAAREQAQIDREAVLVLARRAGGSMRDSQSLLEQLLAFGNQHITAADVHAMLGTADDERVAALVRELIAKRSGGVIAQIDAAAQEGVDLGQLVDQLLGYYRDMMVSCVGCSAEQMRYSSPEHQPVLAEAAQQLGLEAILASLQILSETKQRMRYSTQGRILVEIALVRIAHLVNLASLPELIHQLKTGLPAQALPLATSPAAALPGPASLPAASGNVAPPSAASEPPADSAPARAVKKNFLDPAERGGEGRPAAEPAPVAGNLSSPSDPEASAVSPAVEAAPPAADPSTQVISVKPVTGHISTAEVHLWWRQTLAKMGDMTAEHASQAETVAIRAPNRLVVSFLPQYNFHRRFLERPDKLSQLQKSFQEVSGLAVAIDFATAEAPAEPISAAAPMPAAAVEPTREVADSRSAPTVEEVSARPLVKRASELFAARVVRVDAPAVEPPASGMSR